MLRTGLYYAFNILGVHTVTIGVFEHNDIAHSCYKKVGFVDKEIVPHERDNIIEMAITKEDYLLLTKLQYFFLPLHISSKLYYYIIRTNIRFGG